MIEKVFLEHPRSVDEGYFEHMGVAFSFSWRLICSGLACMVHALIPALFVKTASNRISELYDCMCLNRNRKLPPAGKIRV